MSKTKEFLSARFLLIESLAQGDKTVGNMDLRDMAINLSCEVVPDTIQMLMDMPDSIDSFVSWIKEKDRHIAELCTQFSTQARQIIGLQEINRLDQKTIDEQRIKIHDLEHIIERGFVHGSEGL